MERPVRFKEWVIKSLIKVLEISIDNQQTLKKMSKANEQVLAIVSEMNDETNGISARIDKYIAELENTVEPATLEGLKGISARLKTLGSDPANPIPTDTTGSGTGTTDTTGTADTTGTGTTDTTSGTSNGTTGSDVAPAEGTTNG